MRARASHHRSPGGKRCRKSETRSTAFLDRTRKGRRQSNRHCNLRFGDNTGETSETDWWSGAHMGFPERVEAILN